jgi:hypothetical protein
MWELRPAFSKLSREPGAGGFGGSIQNPMLVPADRGGKLTAEDGERKNLLFWESSEV